MLVQRVNPETKKREWCLVSESGGKVLEWYGSEKPSEQAVAKTEARVQYFKHKGK